MFMEVPFETAFAPTEITRRAFPPTPSWVCRCDIECDAHEQGFFSVGASHEFGSRDDSSSVAARLARWSGVWVMLPLDIYRRLRSAAQVNLG